MAVSVNSTNHRSPFRYETGFKNFSLDPNSHTLKVADREANIDIYKAGTDKYAVQVQTTLNGQKVTETQYLNSEQLKALKIEGSKAGSNLNIYQNVDVGVNVKLPESDKNRLSNRSALAQSDITVAGGPDNAAKYDDYSKGSTYHGTGKQKIQELGDGNHLDINGTSQLKVNGNKNELNIQGDQVGTFNGEGNKLVQTSGKGFETVFGDGNSFEYKNKDTYGAVLGWANNTSIKSAGNTDVAFLGNKNTVDVASPDANIVMAGHDIKATQKGRELDSFSLPFFGDVTMSFHKASWNHPTEPKAPSDQPADPIVEPDPTGRRVA